MIDFEHVSKEYRKAGPLALEDINLHIDDGEFVFLLGHSGAGKSTLLKLILREELPTEGKVTVLGKDVAHLRRRHVPYLRSQMGIIFQDFRLIPSMTVYENIAFAMHVTNVKRSDEPTGNIDPELSLEMMQLLEHVSEMGGITVLVVTHEHELVRQFHQRVVTLKKGRIISDVPADPAAIQARPDHQTMQIDLDPALTEGKEAATV